MTSDETEAPSYHGPDRRSKGAPTVTIDESWNKFLAKLGVGGIAAFLVYQLSMNMQANVERTAVAVQATALALTEHVKQTDRAMDQNDRILRMLLNVNVQQCINATTVASKRDACFISINNAPVRDPR